MRLSPLDPLIDWMQAETAYAHYFAGRYDMTSSWAELAIRHPLQSHNSLQIAAASNAQTGRLEQAHKALARLREINPALRVSNVRDRLGPYRPEYVARLEEGLRKAGLPE
jgi:hypothetical protein